jgi:uncharacterized protein (DUF952 family)
VTEQRANAAAPYDRLVTPREETYPVAEPDVAVRLMLSSSMKVSPMPDILHITPRTTWERAVARSEYKGDTLATEGFIHCCTPEQLAGVYDRYYKRQAGLIVLRIDMARLTSPLKWESPPGSVEKFPHIYGPLNLDAVVEVVLLEAILAE